MTQVRVDRDIKEFSHKLPGEHIYEGITFFGFSPKETLDAVKRFPTRRDDIFLVTYPKAGTTWIQEIVWLITHKADIKMAKEKPVYFRSPFLEFKDDILKEEGLDLAREMTSPRVIKTHLPVRLMPRQMDNEDYKIIILLRNPKDICVSYYHFYRASSSLGNYKGTWPEFFEMFLCGYVDHGSWFEHTRDWWSLRHRGNILILFYEDLKRNLKSSVVKIADFLGFGLDEVNAINISNHCTFQSMKYNVMTNHDDVYSINKLISPFMRKGEVGDWKNMFTVAQSEAMDKICEQFFRDDPISFIYNF